MGMDGLEQGTLVVTATCVYVDSLGDRLILVVWPENPDLWSWDAAAREIIAHQGGQSGRFGHGDQIRLGGGHLPAEYLEDEEWLNPPRAECVTPSVFFASGEIRKPEGSQQ